MSKLIIKEDMERQISEMWDAINSLPGNSEPDRDSAINFARKTESTIREAYRKQEALRDAAPEMLELLREIEPWIKRGDCAWIASAVVIMALPRKTVDKIYNTLKILNTLKLE
jgi:hypothetical protein